MLDVEGLNSEPVNDAIYERNRMIEDRFGIRFECTGDEWPNMYDHISRQVNAGVDGSDAYDLIMLIARDAFKAATNSLLLPYEQMEYIDMEKDYYFQTINDQYRLGNHTFFAFGKDSLTVMAHANSLIYNKDIASDIRTDNLYEMVRNQEWTFEKLYTYAEAAASNLDGNDTFELGKDRLGMIGHYDLTVPCFWISAGELLIEKDEDNMPSCMMVKNERLIDIMQDALSHIDTNAYSVLALGEVDAAFMDDKALFYCTTIGSLYNLRSMKTDYGVIPFPKYDTAQKDYVTRSVDSWLHCVPATCTDTEMTGIIMQALAYYSDKTVYDAYYEQALKTRFMRDADSVEMVEMMLDTIQVDLGDTIWYANMRAPMVDEMVLNGDQTALGSLFKTYNQKARSLIRQVEKFLDDLEEQD